MQPLTSSPPQVAKYGAEARLWWLLALYLCFFAVMWGAVPRQVGNAPAAVAFADALSEYIPMLDQIKKIPGYDPFTRFFYAVQWALMPAVMLYGWISAKQLGAKDNRVMNGLTTRTLWLVYIGVLSATLMTIMWPVNPSYVSWRDKSLVDNIFGIGHFGLLMVMMFFFSGTWTRRMFQRANSIA